MMQRNDKIQNPVITINVEDMNISIEKLKNAGGELIKEPVTVGDMGIAAYFKDSEGNVLGLWENLKK
jgi:predicted enzyme related to lactoylglutathione lyase